jgi:Ca-activated chloride channel family protein
MLPKRHLVTLARAALALLAAALGLGFADATAPPQEPARELGFGEQLAVGWVLVPVVVSSPRGYVDNLRAEDFALFVDDRRVPFESFEQGADAPVSVVFLQDLSGSMGTGGKLEASREAVNYLLEQGRTGDQFAIASFAGDLVQVEVPFTADQGALREAVDVWEAYGTTALHDAVAWLPEITMQQATAKRAAVLLTDGIDNASTFSPEQARELVRRAELPVFVLGLGSGSPYLLAADGRKTYRFADVLNLLAHLTGGRYYPVSGPYDLKEACAALAEELRHQYVLGFATAGGAQEHHRLRVAVDRGRDLKVHHRRGYRGGPPAAGSRPG